MTVKTMLVFRILQNVGIYLQAHVALMPRRTISTRISLYVMTQGMYAIIQF
jgi:hypothetical protein